MLHKFKLLTKTLINIFIFTYNYIRVCYKQSVYICWYIIYYNYNFFIKNTNKLVGTFYTVTELYLFVYYFPYN